VRVISPDSIEPTINPNRPPELKDKQSHRRILSPMSGGPRSLDCGYNRFRAGLGGAASYAYLKDEFCFTSEGLMESVSHGATAVSSPGMFMWRPAGAVTDSLQVREDTLTICAFAPGRVDAWSHVVPPDQLAPWDGQGPRPPIPIRKHFSQVDPTPCPWAPANRDIAHRVIFDRERDGSTHLDVSHTMIWSSVTVTDVSSEKDQLWWLERGAVAIRVAGRWEHAQRHDFVFRAAGEAVGEMKIAAGSVIIGYAAPP
jgi:hypothetical protein